MRELYEKYSEKIGALVMDIVSAFILCYSLSLVVLPFLEQDVLRKQCALYSLCAVLLCVLVSTKKLTLPSLIGIPVILVAVFTVWQLRTEKAVSYILGFINWCMGGLQDTQPYSYDFSIHIVRFLIMLPFAILAYLFFRKLYSFIPLLIVSGVCIVYAQLNELELRYDIIKLLIILLLTAMAHTTHRSAKKKLKNRIMMPEAIMRLAAFVFSIVIVFTSTSIAFADDGKWKSKGLHQLISDVSDMINYYIYGESDSSGYDIGWSGYSPYGDRLGGNVQTNNNVVIHVKTDAPSLLAGSYYNEYDGQKWSDSGTLGSFRLGSFFWRSIKREAFALSNPRGNNKVKTLYDELTSKVSVTVDPTVLYKNVFTSGVTKAIEFKPYSKEVYFNKQGEVYMDKALAYSTTYELSATVFNLKDKELEEKLYELENLTKKNRDPIFKKISASYKSLPDNLPESVYNMAQEITKDCKTPLEKAFAIKKWIQKNCTYTLTPGDVPEGKDFVEHFLETKEGYCTYYASAMAVLSRAAGVPARYVTGFGIKQNPSSNSKFNYVATNETAHAWAEIYISGIGWIPFDATQFNFYELASTPEAEKPKEPEKQEIEIIPQAPSEEYIPFEPIPEIEEAPVVEEEKFEFVWSWIYPVILVLIAIITFITVRVRYVSVGPYRLPSVS